MIYFIKPYKKDKSKIKTKTVKIKVKSLTLLEIDSKLNQINIKIARMELILEELLKEIK